jgi:hypothetical protein
MSRLRYRRKLRTPVAVYTVLAAITAGLAWNSLLVAVRFPEVDGGIVWFGGLMMGLAVLSGVKALTRSIERLQELEELSESESTESELAPQHSGI